jgi:hypothetical protein
LESPPEYAITLKEASAYIGKSPIEFCRAYGNKINYSISEWFGTGVSCEEIMRGDLLRNDYIISNVYYYYDKQSEDEFNRNKKECEKYEKTGDTVWNDCDLAPTVNIDIYSKSLYESLKAYYGEE